MNRKKELKEEYRRMKPAMGVFSIQSTITHKYYLEGATDLKARMNRVIFQLNFGSHPNQALQAEWKERGQESFTVRILDELSYSEEQSLQDYAEEVLELQRIWQERLQAEGAYFY